MGDVPWSEVNRLSLSHTDSQRERGQSDRLSGSHEFWWQFVSVCCPLHLFFITAHPTFWHELWKTSIVLFLPSFLNSCAALSVCLSVGCMKNTFWLPAVWMRESSPARVQMKRSALLDPACVRGWITRTAPIAGYTPASPWDNGVQAFTSLPVFFFYNSASLFPSGLCSEGLHSSNRKEVHSGEHCGVSHLDCHEQCWASSHAAVRDPAGAKR